MQTSSMVDLSATTCNFNHITIMKLKTVLPYLVVEREACGSSLNWLHNNDDSLRLAGHMDLLHPHRQGELHSIRRHSIQLECEGGGGGGGGGGEGGGGGGGEGGGEGGGGGGGEVENTKETCTTQSQCHTVRGLELD